MYTNVIWDFDGTLYDSYPSIACALCRAVEEMGFTAPYEETYALTKRSIGHAIRHYAGYFSLDAEALDARYTRILGEGDLTRLRLFPHVLEILEELNARNGRSFIFTHRGNSAQKCLEANGIAHLFTDVISSKQGFARKPDPAGNLHIIEKYGLMREEIIAVGDREIDILAGKNADVDTCLFADSANPETAATYRIESFEELYGILFP